MIFLIKGKLPPSQWVKEFLIKMVRAYEEISPT
jgi:hypothetical protein